MAEHSTEADKDLMENVNGLFVGLLNEGEMESFYRCLEDNYVIRSYEGAAGFMGLAKIRIIG